MTIRAQQDLPPQPNSLHISFFLKEQKLRIGLVLGQLAMYLLEKGANYEHLLRAFFYIFMFKFSHDNFAGFKCQDNLEVFNFIS